MNKEFASYAQALALKELGFQEPCIAYYDHYQTLRSNITEVGSAINNTYAVESNNTKAPLWQQAFEWFREKHGLHQDVRYEDYLNYSYHCGKGFSDEIGGYQGFETYQKAQEACLTKLIEIVQNGTQTNK